MRVVRPVPEEKHADQDERRGNDIPDKVHPMDALTATKPVVFVIDIKTIPALLHLTNQPRQIAPSRQQGKDDGRIQFHFHHREER